MHSTPEPDGGPCWHCRHYGGIVWQVHARCGRPGAPGVVAQPLNGCAFFERLPGVDDEPGPPPEYRAAPAR